MRSLQDSITKIIYKAVSDHKGTIMANIMINWNKIVGDGLYELCHPIKVMDYKIKNKNVRSLSIDAKNNAIAMEIQYQKDAIVSKTNLFLGYKVIDTIKVDINESLWK